MQNEEGRNSSQELSTYKNMELGRALKSYKFSWISRTKRIPNFCPPHSPGGGHRTGGKERGEEALSFRLKSLGLKDKIHFPNSSKDRENAPVNQLHETQGLKQSREVLERGLSAARSNEGAEEREWEQR